jgi:hypothetical protein
MNIRQQYAWAQHQTFPLYIQRCITSEMNRATTKFTSGNSFSKLQVEHEAQTTTLEASNALQKKRRYPPNCYYININYFLMFWFHTSNHHRHINDLCTTRNSIPLLIRTRLQGSSQRLQFQQIEIIRLSHNRIKHTRSCLKDYSY